MTIFDSEMQKALEADGEYLRQMTGEDHGPYFFGGDDVMTGEEAKWANRLRRVLQDIPIGLEIEVHHGSVQVNRKGSRDTAFAEKGDADNSESLTSFQTRSVYPCSESM